MKEPYNWLLSQEPDHIVFELAGHQFYNVATVMESRYIEAVRYLSEKRKFDAKKKKK